MSSIIACHKSVAASIKDKYPIIPATMALVVSPLLQGSPLSAILLFFQTLVQAEDPSLSYDVLLDVRSRLFPVIISLTPCTAAVVADLSSVRLRQDCAFQAGIQQHRAVHCCHYWT